jgi:hypothetical protein
VAFGDLADPNRRPTRGIRPRTAAEIAFVGLGPAAEAFLRSAAAAGTLRLEHELAGIVELVAVWSREAVIHALERATRFRRFNSKQAMCAPSSRPDRAYPNRCALGISSCSICQWSRCVH